MSRRALAGTLITIVVIILLGGLGLFVYNAQKGPEAVPTPTLTPTPTEPQEITVIGEITDIGGKVDYKNSTLITVDNEEVYITENTSLMDENGDEITVDDLEVGMEVDIKGVPAEGGVEALELTVTAAPTPTQKPATPTGVISPTLTPSPTPTPTP